MSMENEKRGIQAWPRIRNRLFKMVSVGVMGDWINTGYDILSTGALILNLIAAILSTFESLDARYGAVFAAIEAVTVAFFALDYFLRLLTAGPLYPQLDEGRSLVKYIFSFSGIIDLLSFLPYYLPWFFPAGMVVFRMFRVARIFRLFRINAYYDSLNVITEVILGKKQQLLSSVFIILVLMVASSLCMYSVEHEAQPDVFSNAFSGIWWSASTLLTVGYGDIYPVTTIGKVLSIVITFLGVGMVAIPTGIISAGFVEQYQRFKQIGDYGMEHDIHFISVKLTGRDNWSGQLVKDLKLPSGMIIAMIKRGRENIVPKGDTALTAGDRLLIGAEPLKGEQPIELKEMSIKKNHPWNGMMIQELDISRQSIIVMIKRHGTMLVPRSDMILKEGDELLVYSRINKYAELWQENTE